MKNKIIISLITIVILITGFLGYFVFNKKLAHKSISVSDIERIEYWGSNSMSHVPENEELNQFIEWFNFCYDIRLNKDFAGTTAESGIYIILKDKATILVLNSGRDFEIQRNDNISRKNISY